MSIINKAKVLYTENLGGDVHRQKVAIAGDLHVRPGQFINVQIPRADKILKRPFGIIKTEPHSYHGNIVEYAFQVRGEGTEALSKVTAGATVGDTLDVMLPLGNGFDIENAKRIALVGGGLGVFPLVSVLGAKKPGQEIYSFVGYKNTQSTYYLDEFRAKSRQTFVASDDGTIGEKAFVTDLLSRHIGAIKPDLVLACGPVGMYKSLHEVMKDHPEILTCVSLEERMGCGFGVCLACACETQKNGLKHMDRVCKDGPVFNLNEVVIK